MVPVSWRVLWERGGTESDTSLLLPSELAADEEFAYLFDLGARRMVAFRLSDGSVAWTKGRQGDGPGEFQRVEDIAVGPGGELHLADPSNVRIAVVGRDGATKRYVPLRPVPHATSTCPLADGGYLVSTLGSTTPPVLHLSADGRQLGGSELPWADVKEVPNIAVQGSFLPVGGDRCVYALRLGRGFVVYGPGRRAAAAHPYVESYELPVVSVKKGERGLPPSTFVPETADAAVGMGVGGDTLVVAFGGKTDRASRVLDRYDLRSGKYLGSYEAPILFHAMARGGDVYVFQTMRNGYPLLIGATVSAPGSTPLSR